MLSPLCETVILTRAEIDRALDPEKLKDSVAGNKSSSQVLITQNVPEAVNLALKKVSPATAICIAGSLYVAGEAMKTLEELGLVGP